MFILVKINNDACKTILSNCVITNGNSLGPMDKKNGFTRHPPVAEKTIIKLAQAVSNNSKVLLCNGNYQIIFFLFKQQEILNGPHHTAIKKKANKHIIIT